ncbi:enediyne antibiotic chromoprotein [Streptomyces sp. NPDC001250]|uniref:enediyne antibiotic chromoprotein n=1 Tax=unclassified Streptomyces TaxID=2593676 RepID=UPI00332D9700
MKANLTRSWKTAAIGTAAAGLLIAGASSAFAVGPAVTVTPGNGLSDGAVVTASAAGFSGGAAVKVEECAMVDQKGVCDTATVQQATTDAKGSVTAKVTVHKSFSGLGTDGKQRTVDCSSVDHGCYIGVTGPANSYGYAQIAFK